MAVKNLPRGVLYTQDQQQRSFTSKIDPYGFERPPDFDFLSYQDFMSRYLEVLARRAQKWQLYLGPNSEVKLSGKTKRYIRKGIPNNHRPLVWMKVSGAQDKMWSNPGLYHRLLSQPIDRGVKESIQLDLHRTFPENIYFADAPDGNRFPLLRVLCAFAVRNKAIGYCQGLNFIAGILLLIVKDEEQCFWLLDTLANNILPQGYFCDDMGELKVDQEVLINLVRMKCPRLYTMFVREGISMQLFTTKWFICLFVDILPVDTVLRVWDCVFYEGCKIMFRVALTLIKSNEQKFLECRHFADIANMFKAATTDPEHLDCHHFMQRIFREPGSFPMATIDKLRLECRQKLQTQ